MNKTLLFVCGSHNLTPYSEYIPIATSLAADGFVCYFFLDPSYEPRILTQLLEAKLSVFVGTKKVYTAPPSSPASNSKDTPVKSRLKPLTRRFPVRPLLEGLRLFLFYREMSQYQAWISHVCTVVNPGAIIVYGDRTLGPTPAVMQFAKCHSIPTLTIEIAVNDIGFLAKDRLADSLFHSTGTLLNTIVSRLYPGQVKIVDGQALLFYPWYIVLVLARKAMLPPNPWFSGENGSTRHLMICHQHVADYKLESQACASVEVVGQYSLDLLFASYQSKAATRSLLLKKYFPERDVNTPIFLLGLPQFHEHAIFSSSESKARISSLIETVSQVARTHHAVVLLSLHPKMAFADYTYLEQDFEGVRIADTERLSLLLPAASVYFTCFESTISWAIRCNCLPIFLDFYALGFNLSKYASVITLNNEAEFEKDLHQILNQETQYLAAIQEDKQKLAPFDGNSLARIKQSIADVIQGER